MTGTLGAKGHYGVSSNLSTDSFTLLLWNAVSPSGKQGIKTERSFVSPLTLFCLSLCCIVKQYRPCSLGFSVVIPGWNYPFVCLQSQDSSTVVLNLGL